MKVVNRNGTWLIVFVACCAWTVHRRWQCADGGRHTVHRIVEISNLRISLLHFQKKKKTLPLNRSFKCLTLCVRKENHDTTHTGRKSESSILENNENKNRLDPDIFLSRSHVSHFLSSFAHVNRSLSISYEMCGICIDLSWLPLRKYIFIFTWFGNEQRLVVDVRNQHRLCPLSLHHHEKPLCTIKTKEKIGQKYEKLSSFFQSFFR